MNAHLRWMIRRDRPEVLEIENRCFGQFAWSEEDFIKCLRERNCIGMIAEYDERVVGAMIYELFRDKLRVLNFGVHPKFQRQGVGSQMVAKLVRKLSHGRRVRILLEVRETNLDAQLFFSSQGFRCIGVERNFYDDSEEDAYVMQYRLPVRPEPEDSDIHVRIAE